MEVRWRRGGGGGGGGGGGSPSPARGRRAWCRRRAASRPCSSNNRAMPSTAARPPSYRRYTGGRARLPRLPRPKALERCRSSILTGRGPRSWSRRGGRQNDSAELRAVAPESRSPRAEEPAVAEVQPVVLAAEQREDERGVGEGEVKDRDGEGEEAAAASEGRWGVRGGACGRGCGACGRCVCSSAREIPVKAYPHAWVG